MAQRVSYPEPHPARAIRERLQQMVDQPSWAHYLPRCRKQANQCSMTTTESPSSSRDSFAADGPVTYQAFEQVPSGATAASPTSEQKMPLCGIVLQPVGCALPMEAFILAASPGGCGSTGPGHGAAVMSVPWVDSMQQTTAAPAPVMPKPWVDATRKPSPAAWVEPAAEVKSEAKGHSPLSGQVWKLAQDETGCKEVQRAFEEAPDDEARSALAEELRGHVWEALRCPHANYVLQKCIVTTSPACSQFVIDEIAWRGRASICQAARHCFGCRIIERLLEQYATEQVEILIEALLEDALALSTHRYGNYVVQHLLVHGSAVQQQRVAALLAENAHHLGANCYTSAVLIKALSWGPREGQVLLARALLSVPGLFSTMARTRHGRLAAKLVLKVLDVPGELDSAVRHLTTEAASFRASMQRAKGDGDHRRMASQM